MQTIITIIIFILILGVLVFVHELGHYLAAKWAGVYVHEFSLGMGPKIFSFKRKNKKDPTVYSLRALPIGGYCAMAGEVDESDEGRVANEKIKKEEYMCNKPKFKRFVILFAGAFLNFVFAYIVFFVMILIWGHTDQSATIGSISENMPFAEKGIEVGDRIISLNGDKINSWGAMSTIIQIDKELETFTFEIRKTDGTTQTHKITPIREKDEDGNDRIRFGFGPDTNVQTGLGTAFTGAFEMMSTLTSLMASTIGWLFTGRVGLDGLAGPVGMYSAVDEAAAVGISNVLFLMAFLSINLGFVNLMPIPALDGGRIIFIIIEAITRKKVPEKIEGILHTVFFALLMLLILYVTFNDILRLF